MGPWCLKMFLAPTATVACQGAVQRSCRSWNVLLPSLRTAAPRRFFSGGVIRPYLSPSVRLQVLLSLGWMNSGKSQNILCDGRFSQYIELAARGREVLIHAAMHWAADLESPRYCKERAVNLPTRSQQTNTDEDIQGMV